MNITQARFDELTTAEEKLAKLQEKLATESFDRWYSSWMPLSGSQGSFNKSDLYDAYKGGMEAAL